MPYLLWQYLDESVRRHADRPAVAWRDRTMTYRELGDESDRLSGVLQEHGIGLDSRVGLFFPKSHRSVVAMLGIGKAGAVYVPVDPSAPARRAAFILGDCGVRALVTTSEKLAQLAAQGMPPSIELVILADDSEPAEFASVEARVRQWSELESVRTSGSASAQPIENDPAYLLYTSGSTGNPKGVILTHRNALTFVDWGAEAFSVTADDRLSNHAPMHFDLSVFDIYVALKCGACVDIVPDQIAPFPVEMARWIEQRRISVWYSVPSALIRLLLHGKMERFGYAALRTVLFAGEPFPVKHLREVMRFMPHAEFFNLYGPTETNVCTFTGVPREIPPEVTDLSIGTACANTEVFAVRDDGGIAGVGEVGELYVRGPTVMPGYWGMPERSRDRLVPDPVPRAFASTVYRTGDLVRLEADGSYAFLGRRDHMVKSRGYRIELGEIETALYQHEKVREAVVVALPDDEIGSRLKAVVVPRDEQDAPTESELATFCGGRLPRYMVPEAFVFRAELPHTSTGKTDRMALARSFTTPATFTTPTEEAVTT
ncbi:MAG: amino acid adenylation domain-containing protein [Gemmatimonadaceae bacterium]